MKNFFIYFIICIIFLFDCTNPFSTRDAESPDQSSQIIYKSNDKPEYVLENFLLAYQDKNLGQYSDLFAKSDIMKFRFHPEPQFVNDYPEIWTLDDERDYFNRLIASEKQNYPKIQVRFLNQPVLTGISQPLPIDSVESNLIGYELRVDYSDSTGVYFGNCTFKLFQNPEPPNYWSIYEWKDTAQNSVFNRSWSYLKLLIYKN